MKARLSRDEALSFLLSYIVVERGNTLTLTPLVLYQLTSLAQTAADRVNASEGIIPHEVIEELAANYLEKQ